MKGGIRRHENVIPDVIQLLCTRQQNISFPEHIFCRTYIYSAYVLRIVITTNAHKNVQLLIEHLRVNGVFTLKTGLIECIPGKQHVLYE